MSSESNNGMYSEPDDDMSDDENEKRPPVPYVKGWQFTVQQHNAPPPTSPSSGDCTVKDIEETKRLKQLEPIERCLKNPPAEGSYGPFSLDLRVHDTIHIGDKHNAQVVVVEVLTTDPAVKVIHKVKWWWPKYTIHYILITMNSMSTLSWLQIKTIRMKLLLTRPFRTSKAL